MPYCYVNRHRKVSGEFSSATASDGDIKIFYRKYGRGRTKVLLIIGLAGTHEGWGPQVKGLTGTEYHNEEEEFVVDDNLNGLKDEEEGVQVCCFDNRGMGRSTAPVEKSEYSTKIMANDTLALLDHLGWKKAHVFGHSMGGMIACKLAAVAPDRLCSLALLNVTGGGFECFPKMDLRMMSLLYRFLRAKTPEQRALVDLDTHYTKEYLKERLGSSTRGEMLYQEYVNGISSSGMQSNYGFDGQINACWTHNMSSKELDLIRASGFLVLILHGRHDIIAQVSHARKLAGKLHPASRMVELHGAHLVSHERPKEVNCSLLELIKATESNISIHEWSSFTQQCQDETGESILPTENDNNETNISTYIYNFIRKLQVLSFTTS